MPPSGVQKLHMSMLDILTMSLCLVGGVKVTDTSLVYVSHSGVNVMVQISWFLLAEK